jgi:tRNA(fMet)-specific endonuclease VapC
MSLIYLLDTNTISEPLKAQPNQQVIENIERFYSKVALASVVFYELVRGVELLPDSKKRRKTMDYIKSVVVLLPILPYTDKAAKWHGETSARLQLQGKTSSFVDTQIAAVAKTNELILVTRNVRDFEQFTELKIENWFN